MSIRIGILGYGNLGRGVECAIKHNPDMELVAVFTRRDPATVKILTDSASVYHVDEAEKMKDKIDVMILCGGSATDLPVQTPKYAQWFNVVDSFDTHARVPELCDTRKEILSRHPDSLIIAVDASLGQKKHLGYVTIANGALYPGAAVHKKLPPVGHIHITGIVNTAGMLEQLTLQTTRLSTVISIAEQISNGILLMIPQSDFRQTL